MPAPGATVLDVVIYCVRLECKRTKGESERPSFHCCWQMGSSCNLESRGVCTGMYLKDAAKAPCWELACIGTMVCLVKMFPQACTAGSRRRQIGRLICRTRSFVREIGANYQDSRLATNYLYNRKPGCETGQEHLRAWHMTHDRPTRGHQQGGLGAVANTHLFFILFWFRLIRLLVRRTTSALSLG
jgi:hypothetical protein